jgi:hypothetical protein
VDVPIKNGASFHSYVSLPEGNALDFVASHDIKFLFVLKNHICGWKCLTHPVDCAWENDIK